METTNQTQQSAKTDYAAALLQYRRFSRGRSMRQFCDDEGYDYNKFCRYAREGEKERGVESEPGVFLEVSSPDTQPSDAGDIRIKEIRVRFTNGLIMSRRGNDVEEVLNVVRKITCVL